MQKTAGGRRRKQGYTFGPKIPMVWKVLGLGVLAVVALGLTAYAMMN